MSYFYSDSHRNECEDAEYYYCKDCKELVHESEKNRCPSCLLFIPRMQDCICDMLEKPEPDWDWVRKAQLENPVGVWA
jgi:hypothetical protein